MRLNSNAFDLIKEGKKTIESRLFDEKRQSIKLGDEIVFTNLEDETKTLRTKVVELLQYPTFKELFGNNDSNLFGGTTSEELLSNIRKFYTEEEEKKYGVIGIRIKLG